MPCHSNIEGFCEGMSGFELSNNLLTIGYFILPPLIISGILRLILYTLKYDNKKSNIISLITFFGVLILWFIIALLFFTR
jgi:hypothetical protein